MWREHRPVLEQHGREAVVVNFAAELLAALPGLRRNAESMMTDTVRISRADGEPDPLTGVPGTVQVYEGPGKVQSFRPYEQTFEVVGAQIVQARREVHVPVDAGQFKVGDVVEVIASRHRPALIGSKYRVAFPDEKTHQTAQRLLVDN